MERVKTKSERCKQCELCVVACPKKAISFGEDINGGGYRYTVIDHEKCIACGICYTVCPDGVYEVLGDK
ncbi:4Fe-4S binding protein [Clostridiaceae bacterium 35-E11]